MLCFFFVRCACLPFCGLVICWLFSLLLANFNQSQNGDVVERHRMTTIFVAVVVAAVVVIIYELCFALVFYPQQAAVARCTCGCDAVVSVSVSIAVVASVWDYCRHLSSRRSHISRASLEHLACLYRGAPFLPRTLPHQYHSLSRFCFPFGCRCCSIPRHVLRLRLRLRRHGRCQVAAWYRLVTAPSSNPLAWPLSPHRFLV